MTTSPLNRRLRLIGAVAFLLLAVGAPSAKAAPATFQIDKDHSSLHFRIKHMGISWIFGRFDDFSGSIVLDDQNDAACSVQVTANLSSVDTGAEKRDQDLRGPDFFNVAQFPTMTFRSRKVEKSAEGYTVTGDLTLHGVTRSVTVAMEKTGEALDHMSHRRVGFLGSFAIKRSEFGMTNINGPVGDDVYVTVAVEAVNL